MSGPELYSFAVYPADPDAATFDPFVLDVPSLLGLETAARRAWWSAFSYLQRQGTVEPEDFVVHEWTGSSDGRLVTSEGIVND